MRSLIRTLRAGSLTALTLALGAISIGAQPPAADPGRTTPDRATRPAAGARVIGTHHIDRYAAIGRLQETLRQNPRSLSDWIILGELTHEVGVDSPPSQAPAYFKLSRQAYEKALALAPDKPGLKAAVQFARDYEEGTDRFAKIRDRATQTYLDARRRDLAATEYVPTVRVVPQYPALPANVTRPAATPVPGAVAAADPTPAISPAPTNSASTDAANFGVRQIYSSTPLYLPYYSPLGKPLTYQQYSSAYYPPGLDADAGPLPMTVQRYAQQQRLDASDRLVDPTFTTPRPGTAPGPRPNP